MATTSSSPIFIQEILKNIHTRRLLQPVPITGHVSRFVAVAEAPPPSAKPVVGSNPIDSNVVMVLSLLLCALICSLGINSIIKCALRCHNNYNNSSTQTSVHPTVRLANTGIKKRALKTFPIISYDASVNGLASECVICLSEFVVGERVRVLPKCHHGFHVRCIDKWLASHSSCPTCRQSLVDTCQKIIGFDSVPPHPGSSVRIVVPQSLSLSLSLPQSQPEGSVALTIEPLPREGLISDRQN